MLEQTLSNVRKYIPSYWPLQSFIATNPLFDLNEFHFLTALENLSKFINIKGSLNFEDYHNYYANGKISLNSLKYSVIEFLQDNNLSIDEEHIKLIHILTNLEFQNYIENRDSIFNIDNILLSYNYEKDADYLESEKINVIISKFIADFIDLGQAKWKMPVQNSSLFDAWIEYSQYTGDNYIKKIIKNIPPKNSQNALKYLISQLAIPDNLLEKYLIQISFKILGWMSVIKWLEERPDNPYINKSAKVTDLYSMWLMLELALLNKNKCTPNFITRDTQGIDNIFFTFARNIKLSGDLVNKTSIYAIKLIWQRAIEREYQVKLIDKIKYNANKNADLTIKNKAQFVFCIDTRSEGIRRKLEFVGDYQTFGFAGFFAVGFKLEDENTHNCSLQCPVIVKPNKTLINRSNTKEKSFKNLIYSLFDNSKSGFLSPLVIFDVIGIYFALTLLIKTLLPQKLREILTRRRKSHYSNKTINVFENNTGFNHEEISEKIVFVLKSIGLVNNFAKFIIISGHIAESENNPFNSSLDCGACGGNGGIVNSIAFCQAANDKKVRAIIKQNYNIDIPDRSIFISACHNTTTDNFDYYNQNEITQTDNLEFAKVVIDVNKASDLLRHERLALLSGDRNLENRKYNWSELVPEMALANNAAFIIAPRWLTQNINLDRRTFLHSYEPSLDENGDILNFIFNAPVLVGHWINSQYYFSTTDQSTFGSGNKAIHNVVSRIGVMEGNFSDYKIGLPQQSVMFKDKLMHQPLRLTVLVYAKRELVENIINKSQTLKNLFNGRWMHLEIIDAA